MKALIDADILSYEVGFSSQKLNEERELEVASWDFAQELLEKKVKLICEEVEATEPPLLFLTGSRYLNKVLNKQREREQKPKKEFVENFRVASAKEKVYKGTRKADKPYHFKNLLNYMLANYETKVSETGLEADDEICTHQFTRWQQGLKDTIICSRDKDLRQCPGLHYSWEIGLQAAVGPIDVTPLGYLHYKNFGELDAKGRQKPAKIFGVGDKFFYYQMIVGDAVDNIGGLKGKGPVFGYNLLREAVTSRECFELVAEKYVQGHGEDWKEKMKEQAKLLWMVREVGGQGEPIHWTPPKKLEVA